MSSRRSPRPLATNVRKLVQMVTQLRQGGSFSVTRLTTVKRLCADPAAAARFALHLAERTHQRLRRDAPSSHLTRERWEAFEQLVATGVDCLRRYLNQPTPEALRALRAARSALEAAQNQYRNLPSGPVRVVESREALLVEDALFCVLLPQQSADWGYRLACDYAKRYDPHYGSGLIPNSVSYVEEIAGFWRHELGV